MENETLTTDDFLNWALAESSLIKYFEKVHNFKVTEIFKVSQNTRKKSWERLPANMNCEAR